MICLFENKAQCSGCTACKNICANNAIVMKADEEGFYYPIIEEASCTECGACVRVCPYSNKEFTEAAPYDQEVYAGKHKEDNVRKDSASGGAFTAISDYILGQGGLVYGAVFNEKFEVIHDKAKDKEERNRIRGSKYVQSDLDDIFLDIELNLKNGKLVLFTGTPCQNDGLKHYLVKEYDNLILCDIACHGVPSPKVWESYKNYLENKYQDTIRKVTFRSKDKGWHNSTMKVEFTKQLHQKSMQDDPYYIMFFSHLDMRPSCHECIYASYHRVTDLTIADFWGIENSVKEYGDDLGVSLLLENTVKGKEILDHIIPELQMIKSNRKDCYQPIFAAPSKCSPRRTLFWETYNTKLFVEVIQKFGKLTILQIFQKKFAVPLLKKVRLYKFVEKIYYKR